MNPPLEFVAGVVNRKTGEVKAIRYFGSHRKVIRAWLELGGWALRISQRFPPQEYKMIIEIITPDEDPRVKQLKKMLRKAGITIVSNELMNYAGVKQVVVR